MFRLWNGSLLLVAVVSHRDLRHLTRESSDLRVDTEVKEVGRPGGIWQR